MPIPERPMRQELSERSVNVLDVTVECFIAGGQPVSSATVAEEIPERVSPATVRNVMVELEKAGYLHQPHTSAGRVPTARGYGRYVQHLVARAQLRPVDEGEIRRRLSVTQPEMGRLLERACALLSEMSRQVGVVLAPSPGEAVLQDVEFVDLGGGRVLVIFVGAGGVVHSRAVGLEDEVASRRLTAAGAYFTDRFRGRPLREVRSQVEEGLGREVTGADESLALLLGARALDRPLGEGEVLVEGAAHLLGNRELAEAGVLQPLFAAVEERTPLGRVLHRCGVTPPRVMIGEERLPEPLGSCTLIAAGYGSAGRPLGAMGILGPTRMEYARAIPMVDAMARATSDMLTKLLS